MKRDIVRSAIAGALLSCILPVAHAACGDPPAAAVDWQGCDKAKAKLRGATLASANLRGARLQGAELLIADLRRADLREARLQSARLQGSNLQGADLRGAHLADADLRGADLTGADLRGANLTGARLAYADLSEALWTDGQRCALASAGACKAAAPPDPALERWKACVRWCAEFHAQQTRAQCTGKSGSARRDCVSLEQAEALDCRSIKCGGETAPAPAEPGKR